MHCEHATTVPGIESRHDLLEFRAATLTKHQAVRAHP